MSSRPGRGRGRGGNRGRGNAPHGGTERSDSPYQGPPRGRGNFPRGASPRGSSPAPGGGGSARGGYGGGQGNRGGGGSRGGRPPAVIFAAREPARPDQRLSNVDALVATFKKLSVGPEMPLRPGWGTVGREVNLRANFFALKLPTKLQVYDYDVSITPQTKTAKLSGPRKARIFELLETSSLCAPHMGYVAHDRSAHMVSARPLPQPLEVVIHYYEEGEQGPPSNADVFTVEIKLVREINTNELNPYLEGKNRDHEIAPLITALNLILQKHALKSGAVRVGQNKYFFPSTERFQLVPGIEARRGFFMSVRPTYRSLMVNVNVNMAAFYVAGNLAQTMFAFQKATRGGMPTSFSDKLKIVTTHLGYPRKRTIKRVMPTSARKTTFECDELGGVVSVERYFKDRHQTTLRHADDLPVIDVGSKDRPNFLPAEICDILPDQPFRGKLNETATAAMIKVACNPPATNADFITREGLPLLGLFANPQANSTLANFGLSVSQSMTVVPSRILPPPRVVYRSGRPNVRDGGWNILDVKFQSGGDMSKWAVLLVQDGRPNEFEGPKDPALDIFLQTFRKKCSSSGMTVAQSAPTILATKKLPPFHQDASRQRALDSIRTTLTTGLDKKNKPSFILVLLSGVDKWIYPGLKKLCDMQLGLHTVCMLLHKARTDPKKQDQYFSNVALKVNTKLRGVNHTLDDQSLAWFKSKRTMFVGIDVTHPSPTSIKGAPSIAAVVANSDERLAHYPASLRLQTNRNVHKDAEEMVQVLTEMMVERLLLYKKNTKTLPERVIVYRDGVSEGQYDLVLTKEMPQIVEAFRKLQFKPTLSIIICGKRHHARAYATGQDHMTPNGNTVPGTVIDKGITDIYNFDFYLQAHHGLQGTVKKTHYTVVYDENKLSADQIQTGIHNASYLYARATKAVSLVPPAYYADIAAERARLYLGALLDADDTQSFSSKGRGKDEAEQRQNVYNNAITMWGSGIHDDLKETMFYI